MRCATCGERLESDAERCPTCGAAQGRAWMARRGLRSDLQEEGYVQQCPRCGYRGHGVSYFSRPGHVGLLIGLSVFTQGVGGLIYWLVKRKEYVCPNCSLKWEYAGGGAGVPAVRRRFDPDAPDSFPLPSSGIKRRVLGSALVLLASFLIMIGLIEVEAAAIAVGSVIGAAGSGTFFWGWKALNERRQALTAALQRRILRLAGKRGGSLTVTEVAADLNLSLPAAEKALVAMDDGFRVRSEITDEGIIVYEFPEVLHRRQLESGGGEART